MSFITRDILEFYKTGKNTHWYLQKYFSNSQLYGEFSPYAKDSVRKEWNKKDLFVPTIDEDNIYEINRFGLRGEIDENSDAISAGCSITFGTGVPELGRWTNLLCKKINKNIINLGNPGASVATTCDTVIRYSLNNKMPKEIFCLFPDFFRRKGVVDKDFFKQKSNKKRIIENEILNLEYFSPTILRDKGGIFMEVENTMYIEDSISPHQLILDSVNAIYNLEAFCLSNNIKLYWTTWDLPSHNVLEELVKLRNFKLKHFSPFFPPGSPYGAGDYVISTCQLSHKSEFREHRCWLDGSDYAIINGKKTNRFCHPGVHFHTHMAEFFHKLYDQDISNI